MLPQDAVAANLFEIREGQVPSISLTLGASNSKKRSVLSSVSKTAAEAATARSASRPRSSLPIREAIPRTRHGYTPIDLRSTADSLEQRDNIPVETTSNREGHNVTFNDEESVALGGQGQGKRRRHRSNSSSSSADKHYRGMRPKNVGAYVAKTSRTHLEWVRECENVFRIMKREYRSEGSKIRYAAQWLPYNKMDSWTRKEFEYDEQSLRPTWEQFTGFLLDLIEDPTYRPFRNLQRYLAAMQSDQPIHRFVTYLEQLELEIPVLSQEMRHLMLLCKMKPSTQQEILKIFPAPATRDGLVAAAARIEESQRVRFPTANTTSNRFAAPRANNNERPADSQDRLRSGSSLRGKGRGHGRFRTSTQWGQGRGNGGSFVPSSDVNRISTGGRGGRGAIESRGPIVCYYCLKHGHYANACPTGAAGARSAQATYGTGDPKK